MDGQNKQDVVRNLEDAGCSCDTISCFMDCHSKQDSDGEVKLALQHRNDLLDNLHKIQKQIDCLDYLIFQLEKNEKENKNE